MCVRLLWLLVLVASGSSRGGGAETSLDTTRSALEQWVEARQQISRARADWEVEKETLLQTQALFERELQGIEEQFARQGTNTVQIDRERLEATTALEASNRMLERVKAFAATFEGQLRALAPRLPPALESLVVPLLNRMPADPANTRMTAAERVQAIVGILNEVDKFNNGITVASEKRKNPHGEEVAVETVYLGLGAAYFVNDLGDFAGSGWPGAQGWEWKVQAELAPSVREVIRIYRNERPARFVSLPATVR